MSYRRLSIIATGISCLSLFPLPAFSKSGYSIIPYTEVGISHYSLEFKGDVPVPIGDKVIFVEGDNKFIMDFPTIKLGLAGSFGHFTANLSYKTTGEGTDTQQFEPIVPGTDPLPSIKWTGDRTEYSASGAYSFKQGISVFAGYRESETTGTGSGNSVYEFDHDGYFLGGSYRLGLTDTGGLTFSLGYAWLDVELDEVLRGVELPSIEGDGSGVKVGAVWRDFFNQDWGYSVAAEYYEYDYDLDVLGGIEHSAAEMEEVETSFTVGLFYVF